MAYGSFAAAEAKVDFFVFFFFRLDLIDLHSHITSYTNTQAHDKINQTKTLKKIQTTKFFFG